VNRASIWSLPSLIKSCAFGLRATVSSWLHFSWLLLGLELSLLQCCSVLLSPLCWNRRSLYLGFCATACLVSIGSVLSEIACMLLECASSLACCSSMAISSFSVSVCQHYAVSDIMTTIRALDVGMTRTCLRDHVRARAHNSRLGALVATGAALFLTTSLAIDCTCVDKQNV
jgi:hypothetical protein